MEKPAICPHCQGTNFFVFEIHTHKATQNEENPTQIDCQSIRNTEVTGILCTDCEEMITEHFDLDQIEFNFL